MYKLVKRGCEEIQKYKIPMHFTSSKLSKLKLCEMPCRCSSIPQCVAFLGINAEEKLPGLVGPLCGCHNDVVPRVQVHLPPHSPEVLILSRAAHQWVSVKKRLVERTCAVLQLLA